MRPSLEAELSYRKALRELVAHWSDRVLEAIGSHLAASVDDARTDARETALEKSIRLASRPANDAIGVQRARDEVRAGLLRVRADARGEGKRQRRVVDTIAGKVDKSNAREFERVIGINAKQLSAPISIDIERFRTENVELIESIPSNMLDQVSNVVDEAWSNGTRVETLSAQLQERFDVTKSRGDLIARDQTLKLNSKLASSRAQSAGITSYIWTTTRGERVRGNPDGEYPNPTKTGRIVADHWRLEGQRFRYDDPPIVNEATGDRANPGEDYQCQCTAAPVLDFLEGNADNEDE